MQRFSLDRGRFAGHPRRGFPHPPGGSPSPSKSPPEGGNPAPRGAGACRPPVRPLASPSTPLGHPYGVPPAILAGSPSRPCSAMERDGQAKRAGAAAPEKGLEKNQSGGADRGRRPPAVEMWGRWGSRWAGVGAAGGQPPRAVHGVSLPLSTDRRSRPPVAQRSPHLHRPGALLGPLWGPVFAPQGSRLPFRKSSEYTCLSSGPPEARF